MATRTLVFLPAFYGESLTSVDGLTEEQNMKLIDITAQETIPKPTMAEEQPLLASLRRHSRILLDLQNNATDEDREKLQVSVDNIRRHILDAELRQGLGEEL